MTLIKESRSSYGIDEIDAVVASPLHFATVSAQSTSLWVLYMQVGAGNGKPYFSQAEFGMPFLHCWTLRTGALSESPVSCCMIQPENMSSGS